MRLSARHGRGYTRALGGRGDRRCSSAAWTTAGNRRTTSRALEPPRWTGAPLDLEGGSHLGRWSDDLERLISPGQEHHARVLQRDVQREFDGDGGPVSNGNDVHRAAGE